MSSIDFDSLHNISPGKHFYQFYKSREEYLKIALPYFRGGLQRGEACAWIVSQRIGVDRVLEEVQRASIDFQRALSNGQLMVLRAEDWYLRQGVFDEDQALSNASSAYENVLARGYKVLRGAADLPEIPHKEWDRVHAYEAKAAQFIKGRPIIGLCAYPIAECNLTDTKAVLHNHDEALVAHFD